MILFKHNKHHINILQVVSAHEQKGGEEYRVHMTDNKEYTLTKSEWHVLKDMMDHYGSGTGAPVQLPLRIELNGIAEPL